MAYYGAGYAVELLLKAKICKTLDIPDFFDFGVRRKFNTEDNITKPYKVHNFEQLLILSGLYRTHVQEWSSVDDKADWSIINSWNENYRYKTGKSKKDVEDFVKCIKKFEQWISRYL
jgi:hypothetical protein